MAAALPRLPHVPVQSGVGAYLMLTRVEVHGNSIDITPFDRRGLCHTHARRLSDGIILISYGEGRNRKQNMALEDIWMPKVYAVWTKNQREIIATAKQMLGR